MGYRTGTLSVTQNQGIIACLPKPNKNRHFLKNWRFISLLNVVYKLASAVIANRKKVVFNSLIHEDQKGFISGRFIGKNVKLIYDILYETKRQNLLFRQDSENPCCYTTGQVSLPMRTAKVLLLYVRP